MTNATIKRAERFCIEYHDLLAHKEYDGVYAACAFTGDIYWDKFFSTIYEFFSALPAAEIGSVELFNDPNTDTNTIVIYC